MFTRKLPALNLNMSKSALIGYITNDHVTPADLWYRQLARQTVAELEHRYVSAVMNRNMSREQVRASYRRQRLLKFAVGVPGARNGA